MPTKTKTLPKRNRTPAPAASAKRPSRKTKHAPQAKETKSKGHKPRQAKQARPITAGQKQTKATRILSLLRRPDGASIDALCKATGWQAHSVRGFLSGTVRRKLGLNVNAETNDKGIRRYWIESTPDKAEA